MKYRFKGSVKQFKDQVATAERQARTHCSVKAEYKCRTLSAELLCGRKKPTYTFQAQITESPDYDYCIIEGELSGTEKVWSWYHYIANFFLNILLLPIKAITIIPGYDYSGSVVVFSFRETKKQAEKRINKYLTVCLNCEKCINDSEKSAETDNSP